MPIPEKLLNESVVIRRIAKTITGSGDIEQESSEILTDVPMRIVNNDKFKTFGQTTEIGEWVNCSHLGFCVHSLDILKGDFVDTSLVRHIGSSVQATAISYRVLYVEWNPGGVSNHHMELYLERVE